MGAGSSIVRDVSREPAAQQLSLVTEYDQADEPLRSAITLNLFLLFSH